MAYIKMAYIKTFTSLDQSKKLAEFLPVWSADLCYLSKNGKGVEYFEDPDTIDGTLELDDTDVLCWSLAALLSVVPKELCITTELVWDTSDENKRWHVYSKHKEYSHYASNPIDAAVELIFELKEKNKL